MFALQRDEQFHEIIQKSRSSSGGEFLTSALRWTKAQLMLLISHQERQEVKVFQSLTHPREVKPSIRKKHMFMRRGKKQLRGLLDITVGVIHTSGTSELMEVDL